MQQTNTMELLTFKNHPAPSIDIFMGGRIGEKQFGTGAKKQKWTRRLTATTKDISIILWLIQRLEAVLKSDNGNG